MGCGSSTPTSTVENPYTRSAQVAHTQRPPTHTTAPPPQTRYSHTQNDLYGTPQSNKRPSAGAPKPNIYRPRTQDNRAAGSNELRVSGKAGSQFQAPYNPNKARNQSVAPQSQPQPRPKDIAVETAVKRASAKSAYKPPPNYATWIKEAQEDKENFNATHDKFDETSELEQFAPRLLRTKNPLKSIDPRLETSVRTIELKYDDVYYEGEKLGAGAFAAVYQATHLESKTDYAVKKIDREKMFWNERDALEDEIKNLTLLRDGPNIVQLFEVYVEGPKTLLVMEWLRGGELFDRIVEKTRYSEKEARDACRCILNGLRYMHKRKVCHRDLKPENLLLVSREDDSKLKLADFGFAKKLSVPNSCRTLCGTPGYLAPEILERFPAYDVNCDIWSVGVILFLLIGGYLPFDHDDEDQVFELTRNGTFTFHPKYFKSASDEVKDLIGGMLTLNPWRRLTAEQALESEWMKEGNDALSKRVLTQNLGKMSESFRGKPDAPNGDKSPDRLEQLSEEFNHYLANRGRQETVLTKSSMIAKTAVIQDDESLSGLPLSNFYTVGEKLGEGGFAAVYHATHKETRKGYAIKSVEQDSLDEKGVIALKDEIDALKMLRNGPHIVRLYDVFKETERTHLVLELMKGGELLERIVEKEVYTEREARQVCRILFEAIDYMHTKQIAHRDLKLENLLLVQKNNDTSIKIADFGFAKRVTKKHGLRTICGTPAYVAPEVIGIHSDGYDTRCDLWSSGVIVYVLLGGYLPFDGSFEEITPLILKGSYEFHDDYWAGISENAKDLVRRLLQVNPDDRINAEEALQSDWMTVAGATLARRDLSIAQSRIVTKFPVVKLKGAVKAIMATNKLNDLMGVPDRTREIEEQAKDEEGEIENSSSGKLFSELYDWNTQIGTGTFSVVHDAMHKKTGRKYAVKRVSRKLLDEDDAVALKDEITALKEVQGNPHILDFHDVFEEPDYTFIVMELFRGGTLIQRIIQKSSYTEEEARTVCRSLLLGAEYMHSKNIAHRNLKPDNFYMVSEESDTDMKICNFHFAKKVLYENSLRTQCGTEGYVAPEILQHHPAYGTQCDMWSLGVVLYILLGGYRPFRGSGDVLMRQIRYGEYEFHPKYWGHVSEEAMSLISSLLTVNPSKRATATQALQCSWMMMGREKLTADLNLEKLRKDFDATSTFRGAVKSVMLAQQFKTYF